MQIEKITQNNVPLSVIESGECILYDVRSALDLMATIRYEHNTDRIVINKAAVAEDFFILSTGLAGEILQKFVTYGIKFAVYGDFSKYTSKPLKDFIYESNKGKDIFFVGDKESAIKKIITVK